MISFRLSAEEYDRFRDICFAHGIPSLSELARVAMNRFMNEPARTESAMDVRVADLEARLQILSNEIKSIRSSKNSNLTTTATNAS